MTATAFEGVVIIDGPGGTGVALTPEAALESADRIVAAARQVLSDRIHIR